MNNRRRFLCHSSMLSLSPLVPTFLARTASAATNDRNTDRILVVIQLSGGNDGINTVVPYRDEGYAKHRNELRLDADDLIKWDEHWAFHPRLRSAADLFAEGRLSIVHGVGYPNPNRSHFESMDIWHTAQPSDRNRTVARGWLGEAVSSGGSNERPHAVHVGDDSLPRALHGRRAAAISLSNLDDFRLSRPEFSVTMPEPEQSHGLTGFVSQTVAQAYASAEELAERVQRNGPDQYPSNRLAQRLRIISRVIQSGASSRIYYTSQPGYDTHAAQMPTHANLLGELSSALNAFMNDLRDSGLEDQVLVMAFSEFGRRVSENASLGTDHGTAGPLILAGSQLKQRTYGRLPSLSDLDYGDLKHTVDFRDLYASILTDWLALPRPTPLQPFQMKELLCTAS